MDNKEKRGKKKAKINNQHKLHKLLGPDRLDELVQFVQGPVRTGLYRSSSKVQQTGQFG